MKSVRISVIVPVYNAIEFLEKCIDSIINQTEKSLEIILVDDGSTDGSDYLCDTYAMRDNRVKVIHQKNAGVSAARNAGLEEARGSYIGFVDSDDWIHHNMYERLFQEAVKSQAEIVMCDATTMYSNGRTEKDTIQQVSNNTVLVHSKMTPQLLLEMAGATWRCIYSSELIKSNSIIFPIGVKFSEDRIFNIYAMGYANKLCYIKESYYMRVVNLQSAVHRFHEDYFECMKNSAHYTKRAIIDAWNNDEIYQQAYLSQFIGGSLNAINNYFYKTSTLSFRQRREAVDKICDDIDLREAIKKSDGGGIRGKWILKRKVLLLCLCSKILNWKYRR